MRNPKKHTEETKIKKIGDIELTPTQMAKLKRLADSRAIDVKEVTYDTKAFLIKSLRKEIFQSKHWRVRCVDDDPMSGEGWCAVNGPLKKGHIYHVTMLKILDDGPDGTGYTLLGKPCTYQGKDLGWHADRFVVL